MKDQKDHALTIVAQEQIELQAVERDSRPLAAGSIQVDALYTEVSPQEAQQTYQSLLHKRSERLTCMFDWANLAVLAL